MDQVFFMEMNLNQLQTRVAKLKNEREKILASPIGQKLFAAMKREMDARHEKRGSLFDPKWQKATRKFAEWQESSGVTELNSEISLILEKIKKLNKEISDQKERDRIEALKACRACYCREFAMRYIDRAKKRFGTVGLDRLHLAGYLTLDGDLLNFGDPHGVVRTVDHREINEIMDFLPHEYKQMDGMVEFINLGNIRLLNKGVELSKEPTYEQRGVLWDIFAAREGEPFALDIADEDGVVLAGCMYGELKPEVIMRDIDRYFKLGQTPSQSQFGMYR